MVLSGQPDGGSRPQRWPPYLIGVDTWVAITDTTTATTCRPCPARLLPHIDHDQNPAITGYRQDEASPVLTNGFLNPQFVYLA